MPERGAVARSQSHYIAGHVATERYASFRGEHAGGACAIADRMVPYDLSCPVIDGAKESPARNAIIGAGPTVGSVLGFEEIDSVAVLSAHDEQAGSRIKTRRAEVGGAVLVGRYQDTAPLRKLGWIRNRASLGIDSLGPVHGGKWGGEQALAIRPVEDEEVSIARGLHQQLARLAVEIGIHQHGDLVRIPIVCVVRRDLEAPDQFPGVRV